MRHTAWLGVGVVSALVLSACGGGGGTSTTPPVTAKTSLSGTISGFTGAAGTPITLNLGLTSPRTDVAASGTVAADGSFSLDLPAGDNAKLAPYLTQFQGASQPGCSGTLSSSDAQARGTSARFLTVAPAGATAYDVYVRQNGAGTITLREYFYADRATTLSGTLTCNLKIDDLNFNGPAVFNNVALKAGWTAVTETVTLGSGGATASVTVAADQTSGVAWTKRTP